MSNTSPKPSSMLGATVNAAKSLARSGKQTAAAHMLRLLAEHGDDRAEAAYELGMLYLSRGNAPDAIQAFEQSLKYDDTRVDAYYNLATACFMDGDFERSAEAYRQAGARNNNDPRAINGCARALFRLKRDDEAMEVIRPFLEQDPPFPASVDIAALIEHRQGKSAQALERIRKALAPIRLANQDRVRLNYTAGMLCDAMGDYDLAFEYYRIANTYKAKPYQLKGHERYIDRIIEVFSKDFIESCRGMGNDSSKPVFIVGMPRSGTTLTEQILAGHPRIAGAGELPTIWMLAQDLPTRLSWPGQYPGCMKGWNAQRAKEIADEFLADLDARFPDADRVVDKLPGNFQHVGLISCMLPNAKIIHCTRHPLDTCLSCYFQNFAGNLQPYSCDLNDLAGYYKQYQRLMEHWERCGLNILEMRYERTVADLDRQARKMIEFVGMEWDDRCLKFHESKRVIATASFDQADKPIYDQSVERWRHYDRHIGALKTALGFDSAESSA